MSIAGGFGCLSLLQKITSPYNTIRGFVAGGIANLVTTEAAIEARTSQLNRNFVLPAIETVVDTLIQQIQREDSTWTATFLNVGFNTLSGTAQIVLSALIREKVLKPIASKLEIAKTKFIAERSIDAGLLLASICGIGTPVLIEKVCTGATATVSSLVCTTLPKIQESLSTAQTVARGIGLSYIVHGAVSGYLRGAELRERFDHILNKFVEKYAADLSDENLSIIQGIREDSSKLSIQQIFEIIKIILHTHVKIVDVNKLTDDIKIYLNEEIQRQINTLPRLITTSGRCFRETCIKTGRCFRRTLRAASFCIPERGLLCIPPRRIVQDRAATCDRVGTTCFIDMLIGELLHSSRSEKIKLALDITEFFLDNEETLKDLITQIPVKIRTAINTAKAAADSAFAFRNTLGRATSWAAGLLFGNSDDAQAPALEDAPVVVEETKEKEAAAVTPITRKTGVQLRRFAHIEEHRPSPIVERTRKFLEEMGGMHFPKVFAFLQRSFREEIEFLLKLHEKTASTEGLIDDLPETIGLSVKARKFRHIMKDVTSLKDIEDLIDLRIREFYEARQR